MGHFRVIIWWPSSMFMLWIVMDIWGQNAFTQCPFLEWNISAFGITSLWPLRLIELINSKSTNYSISAICWVLAVASLLLLHVNVPYIHLPCPHGCPSLPPCHPMCLSCTIYLSPRPLSRPLRPPCRRQEQIAVGELGLIEASRLKPNKPAF